ncbi:MAG: DsrE family protein [Symbiobacteriaceae bacterium]|nr:DsrE family protein [Symbiobacteriaceae bacterium]
MKDNLSPEMVSSNGTSFANSLLVIWSSGDPDIAERMVFMYCRNSKLHSWWGTVQLCIWGASAKLLCESERLQYLLSELQQVGVETTACIACANSYGVAETLRSLNITVKGMGQPLTEMLKSGWQILTF